MLLALRNNGYIDKSTCSLSVTQCVRRFVWSRNFRPLATGKIVEYYNQWDTTKTVDVTWKSPLCRLTNGRAFRIKSTFVEELSKCIHTYVYTGWQKCSNVCQKIFDDFKLKFLFIYYMHLCVWNILWNFVNTNFLIILTKPEVNLEMYEQVKSLLQTYTW